MKGSDRPEHRRNSRELQRAATRQRLLAAAVASLVELGVARTTTLEVQKRAGVSRGALLHHFSTHAELLASTVAELVRRNEQAVARMQALHRSEKDPVVRAIKCLADTTIQPSFMAELELWAVARTDTQLREALLTAERGARDDHERVIEELFASVRDRPAYAQVVALTTDFARGLALSGVLRSDPGERKRRLASWIWAVRILLEQTEPPADARPPR
ncbi:MAG: TetR/AcrR family transcriptional regulator [Burkholderiaceae bacterium]